MNPGGMLRPALIGGVLLGMLSAIPIINLFNCFCCAWVIGGGMLSSYLYVKGSPVAVTLGGGVALGLLTGVVGTVVNILFTIPLQFLLRYAGINPLEIIQERLEQLPNMPPEVKDALREAFSQESTGIIGLIVGGIFLLVVYSIMTMLGGALGVAIFEKRKPGESMGGPPPPPSSFQPPLNFPPPPPPPGP